MNDEKPIPENAPLIPTAEPEPTTEPIAGTSGTGEPITEPIPEPTIKEPIEEPALETPEQILQRLNNQMQMNEPTTPVEKPIKTSGKNSPIKNTEKTDDNTYIILGVLFVVLLIGAFALFNYLKKRQALNIAANANTEPKQPVENADPNAYDENLFK